jgi:OsmC-like protein
VRSLTVMQKEALVSRTGSSVSWRLSSDEGPYLQGHDFAPAPLAVMTTGLAADLLVDIERALRRAGLASEPLRLVLDTRFTMEGSLPRRTMVGGALPPEITVYTSNPDRSETTGAIVTGVMASPTAGLLGPSLLSRFTLTSNGSQIPVGRPATLYEQPPPIVTLPDRFPAAAPGTTGEAIIVKTFDVSGTTNDAGSSLQQEQRRELHIHAEATRRDDGMAIVEVRVVKPNGSTFQFLSDEPEGLGGLGRAPDAITYISAGIGFCFMTQFGRYAKILNTDLGDYQIVQDTRFSIGDPDAEPPHGGKADAPRTHVYLTPEGLDDVARDALDVAEQTCFIHAMCRTELRPKVRVASL